MVFLWEVTMMSTLFIAVCALAIAIIGCEVVDPTKARRAPRSRNADADVP
jgi:hypothetical protein